MTPILNADKQARFRKKEQLKRQADAIYRNWETSPNRWRDQKNPEDVRQTLEKATNLSVGWTEDDYVYATVKLKQYEADLQMSVDQIANDLNGDWETHAAEFMATPDPRKFIADNKASVQKARALASHIISALKLSNSSDADQAAALMEVVRFLGRTLAIDRQVRCSEATAICLATVGPQYDRPEWFAKTLANAIGKNVQTRLAHEVGKHLNQR